MMRSPNSKQRYKPPKLPPQFPVATVTSSAPFLDFSILQAQHVRLCIPAASYLHRQQHAQEDISLPLHRPHTHGKNDMHESSPALDPDRHGAQLASATASGYTKCQQRHSGAGSGPTVQASLRPTAPLRRHNFTRQPNDAQPPTPAPQRVAAFPRNEPISGTPNLSILGRTPHP